MKFYDLYAENCMLFDNKAVFVAKQLNMIYMLDLTSGEVKIVGSIPEEDMLEERLIGDIKYWNNQIIFIPLNAKKIWIYYVELLEWHGIEFEENISPDCKYKFMGSYLYKDQLYMFGFGYPGIVILDLNNHGINYIDMESKENEQLKNNSDGCFWGMNYVIKDGTIYLASLRSNGVLKFNVETLEQEWVFVGNSSNRYIGIDWDGKYFWLAPRTNGNIVKWDGDSTIEEYPLPRGYEKKRFYFHGVCTCDENILFHGYAGKTLEMSFQGTCRMRVLDDKISLYKKIDDIRIIKVSDGIVWIFDNIQKVHNKYECKINNLQFWEFISWNFKHHSMVIDNTINENNMLNLPLLLRLLNEDFCKKEINTIKMNGKKIYNKVLDRI
ncbi:MAG: hypothetical protein ACI4DK_15210 [Lachnospiraceae bacterium]